MRGDLLVSDMRSDIHEVATEQYLPPSSSFCLGNEAASLSDRMRKNSNTLTALLLTKFIVSIDRMSKSNVVTVCRKNVKHQKTKCILTE